MWRIICPYLINIKKVSKDEAAITIKDWLEKCKLEKCNKARNLEFNIQREVNRWLRSVKPFPPSSKEKLKIQLPELYTLLVKYDIIQND